MTVTTWTVLGSFGVLLVAVGALAGTVALLRRVHGRGVVDVEALAYDDVVRREGPDGGVLLWAGDPRAYRPALWQWPLAAGAFYAVANETPWDLLPLRTARQGQAVLARPWGIHTREELLRELRDLLIWGHRSGMAREVAAWARLSDAEAGDVERRLRVVADPDSPAGDAERQRAQVGLWRLGTVRRDDGGIRGVDFSAWDLVRFVHLVRAGLAAGLLTSEEAEDTALLPCLELRRHYAGWHQVGEHFARARWYWNAEPGSEGRKHQAHTRSCLGLLAGPDGPGRLVPWDLELPRPRWLFAQALADAGLLRPLSPSERAAAGVWARSLDDALTAQERLHAPV